MGHGSNAIYSGLTPSPTPPQTDEIEVSLFGPGYGECVLIHIGNDKWVIVDSCLDTDYQPRALTYLRSLGSNPSEDVCLIVATHWHDDHIRGLGKLVEVCGSATFCCASALAKQDFLATVGALEGRPATEAGSGAREIYRVFSQLKKRSSPGRFVSADHLIFKRDRCRIWSLSPSDRAFEASLQQISSLLPDRLEPKCRVPPLTPNEAAVVLLIQVEETVILLGSDLERIGWLEILESQTKPNREASVFKVPHHGSQNAHEDRVWSEMLCDDPIAVLTPWRKGGRQLPTMSDKRRILSFTKKAHVTAPQEEVLGTRRKRRSAPVERTIRDTGAKIRTIGMSSGMIRLRKKANSLAAWSIDTFGSACRLADY